MPNLKKYDNYNDNLYDELNNFNGNETFFYYIYNSTMMNLDNLLLNKNLKRTFKPKNNNTTKKFIDMGFSKKEAYALSISTTIYFFNKIN